MNCKHCTSELNELNMQTMSERVEQRDMGDVLLETDLTLEVVKAFFRDVLDQKLEALQQRLLVELDGIRSDLQRHPQGSCQLQGGPRSTPELASEPPYHVSNGAHTTETSAVAIRPLGLADVQLAVDTRKDPLYPSEHEEEADNDESSAPTTPVTPKKSWKRTSQTRRGMRALIPPEATTASIAKEMIDKMVIKKDLAELRRQKSVYDHSLFRDLVMLVHWWNRLEEPVRSGCLDRVVKTKLFEILCISVIFINSAFLAIAADWEIKHISQNKPDIFVIAESICSIFFLLELCLRLAVHRLYFFVNNEMRMNIFDAAIVTLGTIDLVTSFLLQDSESATDDNFVLGRIFRLIKLAKMFRTIRALRFFRDIVVILEGIRNSLVALFWIFIMLGMLLFIFSLVFLQGMINYMTANIDDLTDEEKSLVYQYFGSQWLSVLSLYAAVTGGNDWAVYYSIVSRLGTLYSGMFVAFTFFFLFAMFNILTGLFVEKAAIAARPDAEEIIMAQNKKAIVHAQELKKICELLDYDSSGSITWREFETMMSNQTVVAYMASIGLEVHEPDLFFAMVCDSAGTSLSEAVPIDVFVDRCMQFKGVASSIDSQRLLFELHRMKCDIEVLAKCVQETWEYQPKAEIYATNPQGHSALLERPHGSLPCAAATDTSMAL